MRNYFLLFLLLAIASCKEEEQKSPQKSKGIPNALQENSVDVSNIGKRKKDDLVEILYNELVQKDPALRQLENEINTLEESKADSLKPFTLYQQNNTAFYSTYENHLKDIQDSALRKKMKKILDSSLHSYKNKFASHQIISDSTNEMYTTLSDLHWLLKLSKTLSVMEKYQDENIPDTATLKRTIQRLKDVIQKMDSLSAANPEAISPAH